jgi:hypothetical protein
MTASEAWMQPGDEAPDEPREASAEAGADPKAAARPRKDEDPDSVLEHADTPVPSLDELRAAMAWAFEGEEIAAHLLDRFAEHARVVLDGNRRMNLTAIVEPREVAAKHYLDSWRIDPAPAAGRSRTARHGHRRRVFPACRSRSRSRRRGWCCSTRRASASTSSTSASRR